MKLKHLFFAAAAAVLAFAACEPEEKIGVPDLQVTPSSVSFQSGASTQTVTLTATREWTVSGAPEWLAFDPSSGKATSSDQTVTITAMANPGYDRSADVTFTIGLMKAYVHVEQAGDKGVRHNGQGTAEDPYTITGVKAYIDGLDNPSAESPDQVYIKGKISEIKEAYSTSFGNGTFYITDEDGSETFYVYRALYLGNKKFSSKDKQIEVGDEVVICGNVYLFGSSNPVYETVTNKAYLYSLNGETGGNATPIGDPEGSGTQEDPYNVAAALNAVKDLTWTSTSDYGKVGPYYVKGKISQIATDKNGESLTYTQSGTYSNATFYISDDGGTDNEFYCYRVAYLGNKKFVAGQADINVGDEVVIYGELMNYRGDTPETVQGSAYLYSLNGQTGGNDNPPGPGGEAKAVTIAEFNAAAESDSQVYELVGTIGGTINTTYGNFDLTDETGTVYVYGLTATELGYGSKNDKSYASLGLKEGDKIKIHGYRGSYGDKIEVVYAWFIEKVSDGGGGGGGTTDVKAVTIAEFNAAAESDTQVYELVGTIGGTINTTYGNFDLTDETGTVYVYGLTATNLGYGEKNDKSYASLGLNEGDKIKIRGYRGSYGDKIEVVYAWFVEKVSGGGGGGGTTDVKAVTIAEFNAAAESDTQVYELVGTIGGTINTTYGNFDLTDETGTVYVYGLTATNLGYGEKNDKSYASLGLNEGDKIKIRGYRGSYGDKIEVVYAWFVEKVSDGGGGGQGGGETTGDFSSNVSWTSGSDQSYDEKATVNGTADVAVLKLGTGSKTGSSTLTLPAGSTSMTFYALSWKGKPSKAVFTINGEEVGSVEPAANDGLANSSPYTLTVTDSDKSTITFPATSTLKVETSGSNTRVALFGVQAK